MTITTYVVLVVLILRVKVVTKCRLHRIGAIHSNCLLPFRRISCPSPHQALWIQACATLSYDCLEHRLYVTPLYLFCCYQVLTNYPSAWAQAWMTNRSTFYVTRAFIGLCEGGFIPGTILFTTYFYTSKELSSRLAIFWSTLNVSAN